RDDLGQHPLHDVAVVRGKRGAAGQAGGDPVTLDLAGPERLLVGDADPGDSRVDEDAPGPLGWDQPHDRHPNILEPMLVEPGKVPVDHPLPQDEGGRPRLPGSRQAMGSSWDRAIVHFTSWSLAVCPATYSARSVSRSAVICWARVRSASSSRV